MLTDFPVLQVDAVVRRTLITSALVALAAVAVTAVLGQPLAGVGVVLGLAGAVVNHRLFQVSTVRYTTTEGRLRAKPYAGTVASRLGALTLATLVLVYFVRPMGFGMLGGLVAFQALLMMAALRALLRYHRGQLAMPVQPAPSARVEPARTEPDGGQRVD